MDIKYVKKIDSLTEKEKIIYSMAKLGHLDSINLLADSLANLICMQIPSTKKYVLASSPHPHRGYLDNSVERIGNIISKKLKIESAVIEKKLIAGQKTYFSYSQQERDTINAQCIWVKSQDYKGRKVIVIDDLVATGSCITVSKKKILDAGAKEVDLFVYVTVPEYQYQKEIELDFFLIHEFNKKKYSNIIELFNGLNNNEGIINKKLLEFLFFTNSTKDVWVKFNKSLKPDIKKKLKRKMKWYHSITKQ